MAARKKQKYIDEVLVAVQSLNVVTIELPDLSEENDAGDPDCNCAGPWVLSQQSETLWNIAPPDGCDNLTVHADNLKALAKAILENL